MRRQHTLEQIQLQAESRRNIRGQNYTMMLNDLRRKCSACIKNDNHLIYNHPAIANKVYKINDQVSIDFSCGYEKTVENFIGTMIVQEELSKHVKIYAMKSKTTAEISEKLIDYLCTF